MGKNREEMEKKLLKIYDLMYDYFGPRKWWPADNHFEMIVGAILTQAVTWKNTEKALANLREINLLCPVRLRNADREVVEKAVYSTRYYRQKAAKIFSFVEFLWIAYRGDLLAMLEEPLEMLRAKLLKVRGIGAETADCILLYAGQKPIFVIDAYTKRIFYRLGITREDAGYQELQEFFMRNLPEDVALYNEYHALIDGVGNHFCSQKPKCDECPLQIVCKHRRLK